jgi:hypothetical protein
VLSPLELGNLERVNDLEFDAAPDDVVLRSFKVNSLNHRSCISLHITNHISSNTSPDPPTMNLILAQTDRGVEEHQERAQTRKNGADNTNQKMKRCGN